LPRFGLEKRVGALRLSCRLDRVLVAMPNRRPERQPNVAENRSTLIAFQTYASFLFRCSRNAFTARRHSVDVLRQGMQPDAAFVQQRRPVISWRGRSSWPKTGCRGSYKGHERLGSIRRQQLPDFRD
jgi:hypothetical protein